MLWGNNNNTITNGTDRHHKEQVEETNHPSRGTAQRTRHIPTQIRTPNNGHATYPLKQRPEQRIHHIPTQTRTRTTDTPHTHPSTEKRTRHIPTYLPRTSYTGRRIGRGGPRQIFTIPAAGCVREDAGCCGRGCRSQGVMSQGISFSRG